MDTGRGLHHLYQEIIMEIAPLLVVVYAGIAGLVLGWAMPRGRFLKAAQLRLFKGLHNFFADEEEYIAHKVQRIRKAAKKK
jgi:hypothetical protein